MELFLDNQNRELKPHGTYGFPVYADKKPISSYPTGSFPWHWHDEVEFTLAVSGSMEYRVNDCRYLLETGQGLFCNSGALHAPFIPVCWPGLTAAPLGLNMSHLLRRAIRFPPCC